jgi:cytochrome b subunit of formate dehydrogenase
LVMAAYDLAQFLLQTHSLLVTGHGLQPTTTFYNDLFTVMIFTDVLVLILSLVVSGRYEMVFRNAAFVASIILIRLSLTEPNPYGELLTLLAMAFGIVTVLVFNFHMRIQSASGKES